MEKSRDGHAVLIQPLLGNHTAYKQVKGRKTTAEEISELYEGLKQSNLTDFDVLLTGYTPSAEAVEAVGRIGRDLKFHATIKPGSFFWGTSALSSSARTGETDQLIQSSTQ